MDADTHSMYRAGNRGMAKKLGGDTVHLLNLDGTIATIRKRGSDGTFQLTVEVGGRSSERKIPEELAENMRSPEFARAVGEMKAELLGRAKGFRPS